MVDVIKTLAELQTLLADNIIRNISEQDVRDLMVTLYTGYGAYDDQASKDTPVSGTGGVALPITIDALASNTRETRLPFGVAGPNAMWDTSLNRVDLSQLVTDDMVTIRLDFTITTLSPNSTVDLVVDIYNSTPTLLTSFSIETPEIKAATTKRVFLSLPLFIDPNISGGAFAFSILCSNNFTVSFGTALIRVDR